MKAVHLLDNHDMALDIWRKAGVYDSILLHIDAHMDFVCKNDCHYINIGNYLTYAVIENRFKYVYWIVPDCFWTSSVYASMIINQLPHYFQVVNVTDKSIRLINSEFPHCKFEIIGFTQLTRAIDDHLQDDHFCVDIDTDFFMNPSVLQTYSHGHPAKKWCSVPSLYSKIRTVLGKQYIITIASSITGGYTPLLYAYLTEYLYYLFSDAPQKETAVFETLESATNALVEGNYDEAIHLFKRIDGLPLSWLSAHIGLLYAYVNLRKYDEARQMYILLEKHYGQYEAFYFPVKCMLHNKEYDLAKSIIDQWLIITKTSEQANLYLLKYLYFTTNVHIDSTIVDGASRITDLGTNHEKSHILGNIYLLRGEYQKSIDYFTSVLFYLRHNATPAWCNQISSFEKTRNHGIIVAEIYEKLMTAYTCLNNHKEARKYQMLRQKLMHYNRYTDSHLAK